LYDLLYTSSKIIHSCGKKEGGTADTCGTSAFGHPVSVETLYEAYGVMCYYVCFVAELEQGGKARNVVRGVDEREPKVESSYELEIRVPEFEDVYLFVPLS
jgi:hypothetical protein